MFGLKERSVAQANAELPNTPVTTSLQPQSYSWLTRIDTSLQKWWQAIARGLPVAKSVWDHGPQAAMALPSPPDKHFNCEVSHNEFLESQSIRTALRFVGLHLTKQGFTLGQDFSMGQEKLILNAKAYDYLQQSMAPEHFSDVVELETGLLVQDQS